MDTRDVENCRHFLSYVYLDYPWMLSHHKEEIAKMLEKANAQMKTLMDSNIVDRQDSCVSSMYEMWKNMRENIKLYKNIFLHSRVTEYEGKLKDLETLFLSNVNPTVIPRIQGMIKTSRAFAKHSINSYSDQDARYFSGLMSNLYEQAYELCILSQINPLFPATSESESLSPMELLVQKLCEYVTNNGTEIHIKKENDQLSYKITEIKGDNPVNTRSVSRTTRA